MPQLNPAEEPPPSLPGELRHFKSGYTPLGFQLMDKGHKIWGERELSKLTFVAFGAEGNSFTLKIHAGERDAGLAKPAPLVPGNEETNSHPLWLDCQCLDDFVVFRRGNSWLLRRRIAPDAKPKTGVDRSKPGRNRLVHHNAKQLNLVKRRVFSYLIATLFCVALLPPVYVISDMLAAKLSGTKNLPRTQEGRHIAPDSLVPTKRVRGMRIALLQEARDKAMPAFVKLEIRLFLLREMLFEFMRTGTFKADSPAQVCGFLLADASNGIGVADPPVFRAGALK